MNWPLGSEWMWCGDFFLVEFRISLSIHEQIHIILFSLPCPDLPTPWFQPQWLKLFCRQGNFEDYHPFCLINIYFLMICYYWLVPLMLGDVVYTLCSLYLLHSPYFPGITICIPLTTYCIILVGCWCWFFMPIIIWTISPLFLVLLLLFFPFLCFPLLLTILTVEADFGMFPVFAQFFCIIISCYCYFCCLCCSYEVIYISYHRIIKKLHEP